MTDKYLRAGGLTTADHAVQKYTTYFEVVPEDVEYDDIFFPAFYRHHKARLKAWDMIRIVHARGDFDIFVTVRQVIAGGVVVDFHSGRPPVELADPRAAAAKSLQKSLEIKTVPIGKDGLPVVRIEWLQKTKWRLLGLQSEEVKRDMATKDEAETELAKYLHTIRMRLPNEAELKAEAEKRLALQQATA